jgi:hypothetical protein
MKSFQGCTPEQADTCWLASELITRMVNEEFSHTLPQSQSPKSAMELDEFNTQEFSILAERSNDIEMRISLCVKLGGETFVVRRQYAANVSTMQLFLSCQDQVWTVIANIRSSMDNLGGSPYALLAEEEEQEMFQWDEEPNCWQESEFEDSGEDDQDD